MYCAVNTATTHQAGISSIDDGIRGLFGDVTLNESELGLVD